MNFRQRILAFYYRKIHWRLSRLPIQLRRAWRNYSFRRWIATQHWLWVLLIGLATAYCLWWLLGEPDLIKIRQYVSSYFDNKGDKPWTLLLALLGAPVAYVLWFFRHQNTLLQIENQRKDINLKDFQKLSEWVSGLHIPEGKSNDQENSSPIEGVLSGHPTRHDGAASLQIAAIYQLEAFLRGDYGKSFQRPAFQLLKSLWLSLMQPHVDAWTDVERELQKLINDSPDREKLIVSFNEWQKKLWETIQSPLGKALTTVLAANAGKSFREHAEDLPNGCFAGLNHQLPSLKPLELDGLKLKGINFQNANLYEASLQGTDLSEANLQGTSLNGASLQGTDLWKANLQGAVLWGTNLQGANLWNTDLQFAYLKEASLQGANLNEANLQGAHLSEATLHGTVIWKSNLQGAVLRNIKIDNKTILIGTIADDKTVIEVGEWSGYIVHQEKFIPDEAKSQALREQLIAKGLMFVDSKE